MGLGAFRYRNFTFYWSSQAIVNIGSWMQLVTTGRLALVPSLVPRSALLSAMALNSIVWQGSAVVGPAVAGVCLGVWGLPGSFNIKVLSDFLAIATLALARVQTVATAKERISGWTGMREGLSYAWRHRQVRMVLLAVGVLTLLGRPYSQFMPAFAKDVFQVGPQGLGWLMTLPAAGTIVAGIALSALARGSLVRWFLITSAGVGLALLGVCATRSFPVALVLLFIIGG